MMGELLQTAISSIVSVFVLFSLTRIMGKKQVSQLTLFDYVVSISIGSIAAELAVNSSVDYIQGLTAIMIYALFSIFSSFLSLKSLFLRKLLDGEPTILISNGKLIEKNLRKTKMNVNDLLEECRQKDVFNVADIEFAVLETSGQLSILSKHKKESNTSDKNPQGLCVNLIIDGKMIKENIYGLNKDESWVYEQLKNNHITAPTDVLLAFLDSQHQIHIYFKNEMPTSFIAL